MPLPDVNKFGQPWSPLNLSVFADDYGFLNTTSIDVVVPISGGTVNLSSAYSMTILNPATALASLTVVLPFPAVDGQVQAIATTKNITSLTISAAGGATVVGAITTLLAGGIFGMRYTLGSNTWNPV